MWVLYNFVYPPHPLTPVIKQPENSLFLPLSQSQELTELKFKQLSCDPDNGKF